jgi:SAM-dependent methyltransferase
MDHTDFFELNKKMWNDRVAVHLNSGLYDLPSFMAGKSSLMDIETELLGDISGKSILHLQCHFGQDTLSLARMGAQATGIDFSEKAIEAARDLNYKLQLNANFICSDVLKIDELLLEPFDLIFSSYGTIGWLPELSRWAQNISLLLKPGGKFIFVEFHPFVWMFDDALQKIRFSYFNVEPIIEENNGTYADKNADLNHTSVGWNHPFTDVLQSLLGQNLLLESFREYDYSPYDIFPNPVKTEKGYMIGGLEHKLPLVYSMVMKKPV